jgi:hypothetical protein
MSDILSLENFKAFRDTVEVVSFISSPIVAVFAWRALRQVSVGIKQIEVTRDIAKMHAQRESYRLATERCEQFAKEIIPLSSEFHKYEEQKKLAEKVVITETPNKISIQFKADGKWFEEIRKCGDTPWKLSNSLESWSMWFTCKIADEGIAFRPCGVAFCSSVHSLLPHLVLANEKEKLFTHTLRLYTTWRNRIELEKNIAKQQALETDRRTLVVENIKPIGT